MAKTQSTLANAAVVKRINHRKTTIAGYLVLAAAAAKFFADILEGGSVLDSIDLLIPALAGAGLIGASDGGH